MCSKKCEQYIKCGPSNYFCGGRIKGAWVLFFIFCYFLLFINFYFFFNSWRGKGPWVILHFLLFVFTLEGGGGHEFYFFTFCYLLLFIIYLLLLFTWRGKGDMVFFHFFLLLKGGGGGGCGFIFCSFLRFVIFCF
jgi:hypothetical protein